jgi:hypothetical protein
MKTTKSLFGILIIACGLAVSGYSQTFLTTGLVAYYPFNGNANDASGNGNNGTPINVTLAPDRFGVPDSCYSFNGTNSHVDIGSSILLGKPHDAMTLSVWFLLGTNLNPTYNYTAAIVSDYSTEGWNGNPYDFFGELTFQQFAGLTNLNFTQANIQTQLVSSASVNDGKWHSSVVVIDGVGTISIYVDGTFSNQKAYDASLDYTDGQFWRIGADMWRYQLWDVWTGVIDDVRFYNRALSESEVQRLYVYESQTHADGAFQIVYGPYSWAEAKADAESRGGHLATFPYQAKWNSAQPLINQFNNQIVQDLWLGGYQPVGSPEPAGNWSWITGEPWAFSFWWPGEPNNQGGNENYLMVGFGGAGWNDASGIARISYLLELGPRVDLIKAVKPSFSNLTLTTNYQLQVSGDLNNWTNQGSAFTATNTSMIYPQYFDVDNWAKLFFRLQVAP